MATVKPSAKKAPAKQVVAKREIRVRMYNVGFGDAFLILIPDGTGERRILIDCGSVAAPESGPTMKDVVQAIVADVGGPDNARIDLVIGTHRHKDHVSGFSDPAWREVEVGEVWMPWTEDTKDPEARRIRDMQSKLALGLDAGLTGARASQATDMAPALALRANLVENALFLSNDAAMKTLHGGFKGSPRRRFLPEKDPDIARLVETDAVPGVRFHILGPSRDPEVIRDMEPPKGASYLRLNAARSGARRASSRPGDRDEPALPAPFAAEFVTEAPTPSWLSGQDLREIHDAGAISDLAVAVALDKAVNGTSLMIVIEVAGTLLLFPGDAQWGTWMAVLADEEWQDLLRRLSFYKIGHHASHNATPPDFVRNYIPRGCCAMASTLERAIWPRIPRLPLLKDLTAHGVAVARSDQDVPDDGVFSSVEGVMEARIPF